MTRYRFEMVYGLVNNEKGLLVTKVELWDVRLEDFYKGYPSARCVFDSGRHGLIARSGKILKRDYAFIGSFYNGLARMSSKGRLSGSFKKQRKRTRTAPGVSQLYACPQPDDGLYVV